MSKKGGGIFLGICGGILLIILAILIGTSFTYIEYDEIGFKKSTIKTLVDVSTVYSAGRYMWGPGNTAVVFKRIYQQVLLEDLSCFTSSGIEIRINVALQWRYTEGLLKEAYAAYTTPESAETAVKGVATAAIKNNAPVWNTEDFFSKRKEIGDAFAERIKEEVLLTVRVEVGYVQLLDVSLTNADQIQRYLDAANQIQSNQREEFIQNSTLLRTQTVNLQATTLANITLIRAKADAAVQVKIETAKADAKLIEVNARRRALSDLFNALGLTTSELQLNYLYITAMGTRAETGLRTKFLADLPVNLLSLATN